jgi:hypothetical protein
MKPPNRCFLDFSIAGKIAIFFNFVKDFGLSAAYQKLCKIGYVKKEGHILPENRKATQKLRRIHPWIQQ